MVGIAYVMVVSIPCSYSLGIINWDFHQKVLELMKEQ
jgi:hypothetical protein